MLKRGKGLWEQISQSNKREYVMMTGESGMRAMTHAFSVQHAYERLKRIKVSPEENISLRKMIESDDYENLTVAELILDQYEKR